MKGEEGIVTSIKTGPSQNTTFTTRLSPTPIEQMKTPEAFSTSPCYQCPTLALLPFSSGLHHTPMGHLFQIALNPLHLERIPHPQSFSRESNGEGLPRAWE